MITRRSLLWQAGLLAAGGAGYLLLRQRMPGQPPRLAWDGGEGPAWMPLSGAERRLAIVEARVNGEPAHALIDSGAQVSVIDKALAEELGARRHAGPPVMAFGLTGQMSLGTTTAVELRAGGLRASQVRPVVLDLAPVAAVTGRRFGFIIGRDVLSQVVADLDFPGRRAAFHDPAAYALPRAAEALGARLQGGALYLPVTVEGRGPLLALVDTGASSALAVTSRTAGRLGLLDDRHAATAPSISLGGISHDKVVRAERMAVAGRRFDRVRVQIFDPAKGAPLPDGLLGTAILGQFRLILDHGAGTVHLIA